MSGGNRQRPKQSTQQYQETDSRAISEEAAENAVRKVFAVLGVDIDKPESVEEFREDLRFGKKMRKMANHGTLAFVAVAASALAYAMYAGIVSYIKKDLG